MEIRITTNQVLKVLEVISWIIFIGLCVEAGAILVNGVMAVFFTNGNQEFWDAKEYLLRLYKFNQSHFVVLTMTMVIVTVLKALMFYLIVRVFSDKRLNISRPFSTELRRFIIIQSFLALGIGLFSHSGYKYSVWLAEQGMEAADLQALNLAGADVWLFMTVILVVIAQVVKKGIDVQNENDLTI